MLTLPQFCLIKQLRQFLLGLCLIMDCHRVSFRDLYFR